MDMMGELHTLAALFLEKDTHYPLDRRLGGPKSQCEALEKRKPHACLEN
jgi:hypothetical protein